jgi:hypothetical protein
LPQQPLVSACFEGDRGFYVFAAKLKMVCSHFENVVALTGKDGLKPITVCDVVANPNAYAGRDVAVLGRLGQTMEGAWLSEDHCEKQIETDGYVWPSSIWIAGDRTAPDPPLGLLVLDGDALSEKVASVRGTTVLRTVKTVCWTPSEKPHQCEVQENWSVIYGRIETQQILRRPNGSGPDRDWGNGFGHLNSTPLQILRKPDNSVEIRDDDPFMTDANSHSGSLKAKP